MNQPDFTSPIAGRIEVREPCPWCADRPMIPRSLMGDHVAQQHPEVQTAEAEHAVQPPADRAALRDRIADVLADADGWKWVTDADKARSSTYRSYQSRADAVLAVLPEPVDRAVVRAETLREAADFVDNDDDCDCGGCDTCVPRQLADGLRHLAGEQPAPAAPTTLSGRIARLVARDASALRMDLYDDVAAFARETGNTGLQHAQIRDHLTEFLFEGLLRRLAGEQPAQDEARGCAHCGGPHAWDDCEAYTALVAADGPVPVGGVKGNPFNYHPEDEPPPVCQGFVWIGQSFAICERCGQPAWEHAGVEEPVERGALFDDRTTVRPWKPGEADAMRAKWARKQPARDEAVDHG